MMTMTEQQQRARERAFGMRTFKLTDGRTYLVRSRSVDGWYTVQTNAGRVSACDCDGWHYRGICKHSEAVNKRLDRERKPAVSTTIPRGFEE